MPTARIVAAYVNPPKPGKTRWTIKDESGVLWGAMPDVAAKFRQGGGYDITYREETFRGNVYKIVETANEVAAPSQQKASAPADSGGYKPYDADTQKRIFVCGALNAMLGNPGMFQSPPSADTLINIINTLCTANHNSMLSKNQKWDEQMGDEIPFE